METNVGRITEAELLAAIAQAAAGQDPSDALTAREMAKAHNISVQKVRRALEVFAQDGRLVVHRVRRTAVDFQGRSVPAYTIKTAAVTNDMRGTGARERRM